ncbi:hypothetical protein Hanom_Chr10g00939971 [Helianthus anomalus]
MDKGTSESSLLGAGSPLPSIPLHSIVSYCTVPLLALRPNILGVTYTRSLPFIR